MSFDTALESSAAYACIKTVSEDVSSMPFFLYQREGDITEKALDHPLYEILHDLANPETSAGEMVEAITSHAMLGNGYAIIQRDGQQRVQALWPVESQRVKHKANSRGVSYYEIHDREMLGSQPKQYPRDEIFHLRGFTLDGRVGDDVLKRARHMLGLTLAGQKYAGKFFANDASPGLILELRDGHTGLKPSGVENLKKAWKLWHRGKERAHEPAVVQDGFTAKRLDPDHSKLQLIEQREFQVTEVCRIFRVPPHMIADLKRATFSNIDKQDRAYMARALRPWVRRWRQEVYRSLLTPKERQRYFAEHSVDAYQQGDFETQNKTLSALLDRGVVSVNQVRRMNNWNPVPGGDEHRVQMQMTPITAVPGGTNGEPSNPKP